MKEKRKNERKERKNENMRERMNNSFKGEKHETMEYGKLRERNREYNLKSIELTEKRVMSLYFV